MNGWVACFECYFPQLCFPVNGWYKIPETTIGHTGWNGSSFLPWNWSMGWLTLWTGQACFQALREHQDKEHTCFSYQLCDSKIASSRRRARSSTHLMFRDWWELNHPSKTMEGSSRGCLTAGMHDFGNICVSSWGYGCYCLQSELILRNKTCGCTSCSSHT